MDRIVALIITLFTVLALIISSLPIGSIGNNENLYTGSDLEIELSRSYTVVGTPVSVRADGGEEYDWEIISAPAESEADFHDPNKRITSIRPDKPGEYEIKLNSDGDYETICFIVDERSDIVEEFAPRLYFHGDTEYRPTRIEALVENSILKKEDVGTIDDNPTVFSLENKDDSHYIELVGSESDYPSYQEDYEPTIYANVIPETEFQGETYTAITYWFIYTYDPKYGFATFGSHQGDVESTVVLINEEGEGEYLAPAQHGAMSYIPFEQATEVGNHVALYPEHKAHATFLRDTSAYDGSGIQVYSFWSDPDADPSEIDEFESIFHSEWTGSAESWSHDGSVGVEYNIIELTGDEIWSTYEGGLNDEPGSITPPHQREHFVDPGQRMEDRGAEDYKQIEGSLSADLIENNIVEVSVSNDLGKPHEFWVTVETDKGEILGKQPVGVGCGNSKDATIEFNYTSDYTLLTAELWLYPPDLRRDHDFEDEVVLDEKDPLYELSINIEGEGDVIKDPDLEKYEEGTEVTLTVDSDEQWYFSEWVGDYESEDEEIMIEMNEDKGITAVFKEYYKTMDIDLSEDADADGWNFVSVNLNPDDTNLESILESENYGISGSYDRVMYYDAKVGEWLSYIPGRPEHFNNLETWDHTMGVWIQMNADDTLTIEGTEPTSTDITLQPGWNMVGLPSSTTGNHDIPAEVSHIGYFDASVDNNLAYDHDPANFTFSPSQGYWIYNGSNQTVTWTIEY
ncbi:MAG: hypothetical protein R6W73_03430 [Candidatus Saliniplasma sp.]